MSCGCPAIYTNMKYKHVLELWADLWPADTSKNISFFSSKGSCFQSHVSLTYVSILSYISWTSFLWLWNPRDWMSGQQWVNSMCVCVCVCVCMHTHMHTHTHTHTVSKSCQSICDPMDCSPPGSSVHGISQARILEWVAISSSRGPSWSRDRTCVSFLLYLAGGFFITELPGKPSHPFWDGKDWGGEERERKQLVLQCHAYSLLTDGSAKFDQPCRLLQPSS